MAPEDEKVSQILRASRRGSSPMDFKLRLKTRDIKTTPVKPRYGDKVGAITTSIAIVGLLYFFVVSGFETSMVLTTSCTSVQSIQAVANYAQTESGVDWEGYSWTETERWAEDASDTFTVEMTNNKVSASDIGHTMDAYGIAVPNNPSTLNRSLAKAPFFTQFSYERTATLQRNLKSQVPMILEVGDYQRCIGQVGKMIILKKWYFLQYKTLIGE